MSVLVETPVPSSFYIPPTQEDDSTVGSFHAGIENIRMSKKSYEDGYRCIMKKMKNKNSKKSKTQILEYFTTKNVIGQPIRNARTGYLYSQYHVGHLTEYLFFKTRICTNESYEAQQFSMRQFSHKSKGVGSAADKLEPEMLFYDCPEEYETHQQITLSQELKDQWRERYERLLRHLEKTKRNPAQNHDSHIQLLSTKSSTAPSSSAMGLKLEESKKRPPSPDGPPPGFIGCAHVNSSVE